MTDSKESFSRSTLRRLSENDYINRRWTLVVAPVVLVVAVMVAVVGAEPVPTVTTDKLDYRPGEVVIISGAGFDANTDYDVPVIRPDNTVVVGDGTFTPGWDTVTTDVNGDFDYYYDLDGILGLYEVRVYPVEWAGDLTATPIATTTFTDKPQASLEQCRNGELVTPNDCKSYGGAAGWVTGNAGSENSHYIEGYSVSYRIIMEELPIDDTMISLTIGYDTKHSGKHALDYLTHYDHLESHIIFLHPAESISPTDGVVGNFGVVSTFPIPSPTVNTSYTETNTALQPVTSFESLPVGERVMTLFGGNIVSMMYETEAPLDQDQSETSIKVVFTATSETAVLAWGGHIASRKDWGTDLATGESRSAGELDSSPYHMRLKSFSLGEAGNQDRSLKGGAVIIPGTKSGTEFEDSNKNHIRDANEPVMEGWVIDLLDASVSPPTFVISDTTDASGYYTFTEIMPGNNYLVCEVQVVGWWQLTPQVGDPETADCATIDGKYAPVGYLINLDEAEVHTGNDFGNFTFATFLPWIGKDDPDRQEAITLADWFAKYTRLMINAGKRVINYPFAPTPTGVVWRDV